MFLKSDTILRVSTGALLPVLGQPLLALIVFYEASASDFGAIWGNFLEYFLGFWLAVEVYERGGSVLQSIL